MTEELSACQKCDDEDRVCNADCPDLVFQLKPEPFKPRPLRTLMLLLIALALCAISTMSLLFYVGILP